MIPKAYLVNYEHVPMNLKISLILLLVAASVAILIPVKKNHQTTQAKISPLASPPLVRNGLRPFPTVIFPAPTPTSTPKPLTFAQVNKEFGPCAYLPVLMYHHIQPESVAKADGQTSLTVDTTIFQKQLEYLRSKNYHSISPLDLIRFFDNQISLPSKPVLLTFDDAYADFATDAVPLLRQYSIQGTLFVPTGLVDNPGYLTWSSINEIKSSNLVTIANHTWSHHPMKGTLALIQKEISLAKTQLVDHGYTNPVFAYPYGTVSQTAIDYLAKDNFSLAFTTRHGSIECKQQRLQLPRIRVGNAPLTAYGL